MDPARPELGFMFDGRIAEDFKLSTGTFVSVGPLRAKIIAAGDPIVQDVVIAGIDRDDIGILIVSAPRRVSRPGRRCRRTRRRTARSAIPRCANSCSASSTTSGRAAPAARRRVARALVLAEPPSIDRGEITDKGSINQRAVLTHRAADVERLYLGRDRDVLVPRAR